MAYVREMSTLPMLLQSIALLYLTLDDGLKGMFLVVSVC